jgi:endoglucanase
VDDEFYWAAAELFITTGQHVYRAALESSPYFVHFPTRRETDTHAAPFAWGDTAALGTIALAMVPNALPSERVMALRAQIVAEADRCLHIINGEGYRVPLPPDLYFWGSTSDVLNEALILALAYDFTGEGRYLDGVTESMDYLLGRNALGFSFVAGYGVRAMQHPHHRFWADQPEQGFPPPPPGALSGGPNARPTDPTALNSGVMVLGPARRYVDHLGSWSTNEVAINWNAPLVWVAAYLDAHFGGNIG